MFGKILRALAGIFVLYSIGWGIAIWQFPLIPTFAKALTSLICIFGSVTLGGIMVYLYRDSRGD